MSKNKWALALAVVVVLAAAAVAYAASDGARAAGTAIVVSSDGHLLTCAHVVKDAVDVHVRIQDTDYTAAVLAVDEAIDLALLKVNASGLRAARLGGPNPPQPGQRVWAFGFPLSAVLGETVKVTSGAISGVGTRGAQQVLQIDAAVNPGNSGGPLVDDSGAVVGIVNAKLTGEEVSNVGFAIPISYARSFLRKEEVEFRGGPGTAPKQPGPVVKRVGPAPMDGPAVAKAIAPIVAFVTIEMAGPARPTGPVAVRTIAAGKCWSFALAPDGKTLACSGGETMKATIWDVTTGELLRTLFLPDTDAYAGYTYKRRINAYGKALSNDFAKGSWLGHVTFSPDGGTLAGDNPPIAVVSWDVRTGEPVGVLPTGVLGTAFYAYSPDGEWLLHGAGWKGWDAEALNLRTKEKRLLGTHCNAVAVSPDSSYAAIAYSASPPKADDLLRPARGEVQLVRITSGEMWKTLRPKTTGVHDVSFSPDGRCLAGTDSDVEYRDGKMIEGVGVVSIWDLQSGEILRTLSWPGLLPGAVCFSPSGKLLAVSFHPTDERLLYEAREGSVVVLWDTRTWEPSLTLPGMLGHWHTGAFSRDGQLLATKDVKHESVTIWRVASE
jgi:WD40 repeat protein